MRRLIMILTSCMLVGASVAAQDTHKPFSLQTTTQLVVRTVSVEDAEGNPIEGLMAGDFVLKEDGVPQVLSIFEFQKVDDTRSLSTGGPPIDGRIAPSPGNFREGYKDRRLLAFYFDLGAMQAMERTRALGAAREFVETHMTASDLVAILSYSEGIVRMVQDFTDSQSLLGETISALLDRTYRDNDVDDLAFGQNEGQFNIFSTDRRLMALQTATRMLGVLSQAKSLMYFSSGVGLDVGNQAQLRATVNSAVRANVSIYPIDVRGLTASAPMGNASQRSPGGMSMYTGDASMDETRILQRSQDALYTLAADSGGKALLDSNDLASGIRQAQRAMSSYYIVGYYPTNTARDGRLRRLSISLKGRPARLSYRETYYANKEFSRFTAADKERQLEDALLLEDPITELTIAMELNYFQLNGDEYFAPLSVRIPGSELVLAQKTGAARTAIDFIGEIRDESGTTVTNLRDKVEIRLSGALPSRLATSPVQYDAGFLLPSGRYVVKFLARNADTGRIGTYQTNFVVPNLREERQWLPISSVVLGSQRVALTDALYDAGKDRVAKSWKMNPLVQDRQKLIPSISRVFSKTHPLYVYLQAYERNIPGNNALAAFVTFYREHEKVFETPIYAVPQQTIESGHVPVNLTVGLGDLPTGEYTCQVTVLHPGQKKVALWQTPVLIIP